MSRDDSRPPLGLPGRRPRRVRSAVSPKAATSDRLSTAPPADSPRCLGLRGAAAAPNTGVKDDNDRSRPARPHPWPHSPNNKPTNATTTSPNCRPAQPHHRATHPTQNRRTDLPRRLPARHHHRTLTGPQLRTLGLPPSTPAADQHPPPPPRLRPPNQPPRRRLNPPNSRQPGLTAAPLTGDVIGDASSHDPPAASLSCVTGLALPRPGPQ